jgi:hypothetical protein
MSALLQQCQHYYNNVSIITPMSALLQQCQHYYTNVSIITPMSALLHQCPLLTFISILLSSSRTNGRSLETFKQNKDSSNIGERSALSPAPPPKNACVYLIAWLVP